MGGGLLACSIVIKHSYAYIKFTKWRKKGGGNNHLITIKWLLSRPAAPAFVWLSFCTKVVSWSKRRFIKGFYLVCWVGVNDSVLIKKPQTRQFVEGVWLTELTSPGNFTVCVSASLICCLVCLVFFSRCRLGRFRLKVSPLNMDLVDVVEVTSESVVLLIGGGILAAWVWPSVRSRVRWTQLWTVVFP